MSGPLVESFGEFPVIFVACVNLCVGQFILAAGPQTVVCVVVGIGIMYGGLYPIMIASMSLFRRICKTYNFDYKEMADVFSTGLLLSSTISVGICSAVGGVISADLGFRKMYLIFGIICTTVAPAFLIGFHPDVLGRPLAKITKEDMEDPPVKDEEPTEPKSSWCVLCP